MKRLFFILFMLPLFMSAQLIHNSNDSQSSNTGIRWIEGLSWEQIKKKAKVENKYIFIDAFATWCGPCKIMDRDVYTNDTVGNYFNANFISIKVQMDKTKSDNDFIQSWYNDASYLNKQYRILGYPSYIFFSPEGTMVHQAMGFVQVNDFINIARIAVKPGKVYIDPYEEYNRLMADYKQGIKNYDKMPYMIRTAYQFQDDDIAKQLLNEHTEYVEGLNPENRYTKENIELWASFMLASKGKRFSFFYHDGDKIDRVMNKKGYAAEVVDRTINTEILLPFFSEQPGGTVMSEVMMIGNPNYPDDKCDPIEADWKKLYKMIRKKYNTDCTKRNIIEARLQWYRKHNNGFAFAKYYLQKLDLNGGEDRWLNSNAWYIFINVTDKIVLNKIISYMEKMVKEYPTWTPGLDTYANLLYKAGRKEEAIHWETKAIHEENREYKKDQFRKVIEQMKKGEPTYGAIWK